MRVIFVRVPDHQRGYALVTRADGVRYRLNDGPVTGRIPHDLTHFTVEHALGIGDGIWAAIAGGVVFSSMTHVSGRRPPHAAQRSAGLMRANGDNLNKAELIANLVERTEAGESTRELSGYLRGRHGWAVAPGALDVAVGRLRAAAAEWAALEPGDELVRVWPAALRLSAPARGHRGVGPARGRRGGAPERVAGPASARRGAGRRSRRVA
ncbi:hypothetical protein [Virgisporangium ochraceum]|uniref:Uncharacterized protein n=1 Tax=Virgisporangium ochraceum TaxID=65505 RepID=A0A8J3ZU20_9ACTN|nr:hypothetical protein [Virgisporangium ochraceum]GIJ68992.1 hypothetical protein Voc01_039090 [Virgisporangium ochraceum]